MRRTLMHRTLMRWTLAPILLAAAGLLAAPQPADAQAFSGNYTPVRLGAGLPDIPGGFHFCRLAYSSSFGSFRSRWTVDFPEADRHIMLRLAELTPTPIAWWSHGEPGFAPMQITDPDAYRCPFFMAVEVGQIGFNQEEVAAMRNYLLKGGFLWVDDYWGSAAWNHFERQMRRVLPEHEFVDVPLDHPLFNIVYRVPEVPQIPSINFWLRTGGQTSERGLDSQHPSMRAIFDDTGRILVLSTHNTDIADGWEREMYDVRYFQIFSPVAYAIGVNVLVWMMTH